jgi:FAD/FMN-containing dehydrogenase
MLTRRELLGWGATAGMLGASGVETVAAAAIPPAGAADALKGKVFFKNDARYESYRQAATWNARKPAHFPNAIVLAQNEQDVIAAVKLARERDWQVTARSGGHSWRASHTRDNSVQVNLARMQQIEVDRDAGIVKINPSVYGNVLNKKLREEHQLFVPSAHGVNVGMGGFVMCGGHGWNSRVFGLGCENLMALDLVTADGELIHASETENSDYLWAARGSGPGFFGVATRYYLKTHALPKVMKQSVYVYPMAVAQEVVQWARTAMSEFPRYLEVIMVGRPNDGKPTLTVVGNCLGDSDEEVNGALALMERCPAVASATFKIVNRTFIAPIDVEPATDVNPTGARFAVDNTWTDASAQELAPYLTDFLTDYPTPKSYVFLHVWGPVRKLPDMAYSVQGDMYFSSNAVYYDPADDARCEAWAVGAISKLDRISTGAQMNDENIEGHAKRYLSDAASARLETLRKQCDPQRRFPGYINRVT